MIFRNQKITVGETRASGVLIYCADYKCSHWIRISADQWSDQEIRWLLIDARRDNKPRRCLSHNGGAAASAWDAGSYASENGACPQCMRQLTGT